MGKVKEKNNRKRCWTDVKSKTKKKLQKCP